MRTGVRLFLGNSFESVWAGVVNSWFQAAARDALQSDLPSAVVVPSRPYAAFLKHCLLREGISVAGVRFWTPGESRLFLLQRQPDTPAVISREDLHLLLSSVAESVSGKIASSAARDASGLMTARDLLDTGGYGRDSFEGEEIRSLLAAFEERLQDGRLCTAQQVDRSLLERARRRDQPWLGRLLLMGFDGAHWEYWNLLRALVDAAAESTCCLLGPRFRSEHIDQTWIGSWEQVYGPAAPVGDPTPVPVKPFAALAGRLETDIDGAPGASPRAPVTFLVGSDLHEEAEAVIEQTLRFLSEPACDRLGIVFPAAGGLSRTVAARLSALGIPYHDSIGHWSSPSSEDQAWQAWIEFQRHPTAATLLELAARASRAIDLLSTGLDEARSLLEEAYTTLMMDDLPVMASFLQASGREAAEALGRRLASLPLLPDQGNLDDFLEATVRAVEPLGLGAIAAAQELASAELRGLMRQPFSRSIYLRWLADAPGRGRWLRDDCGSHPFARIHLLTYRHAEWQVWSHLILTELNENQWPPPHHHIAFLSDDLIEKLNRSSVEEGSQGQGHQTVAPGRALLLGPAQRRALVQRQLFNIIESVRVKLAVTAALTDESDLAHLRAPSDFLLRLYYLEKGTPLTDAAMDKLREATRNWLRDSREEEPSAPPSASVLQTRAAFQARRDGSKPFGRYDCALEQPPAHPIVLGCKDWEQVMMDPAAVWTGAVLGVSSRTSSFDEDTWALSTGTWAHSWLGRCLKAETGREGSYRGPVPVRFTALPEREEAVSRLKRSAIRLRESVHSAFAKAGRALPDWWFSSWSHALWKADRLLDSVVSLPGEYMVLTEWSLPKPTAIPMADGSRLLVRGRIDLVLYEHTGGEHRYWVVDYKTGASVFPLAERNFLARLPTGAGIQPGLYALALHALGADRVQFSLLTPDIALAPQVGLAKCLEAERFWSALQRMQATGVFGVRGELRPEFGSGRETALATLAVDEDLLEARWLLTHPGIALENSNPDTAEDN